MKATRWPLPALRAFVEVGRLGSIKAAAEALGVTPGAVSQQLKLLEARLGVALLERSHRRVRLTSAGASLLTPIADSFGQIDEALEAFAADHRHRTLTLSTTASFAGWWLIPRLARFSAKHPRIEIRLATTTRTVDLLRDHGVDAAIRYGRGDWPDLFGTRLVAPRTVAVGSPELISGEPPLRTPADCLTRPLLQDAGRAEWPAWLAAHGVACDPRASRGPSFEDDLLLVCAAASGQGLALVREIYVQEELAKGTLVKCFEAAVSDQAPAYYFVCRPEAARMPAVEAFREWLLQEAAGLGRCDETAMLA